MRNTWEERLGKTSFKLQPPLVLLEPSNNYCKAEGGQDPCLSRTSYLLLNPVGPALIAALTTLIPRG